MPNPTSGALSSLLGSGTEGRKALGTRKRRGGDLQLWIQLYIISFFLFKVFTEQGATSETSCWRPEGGSESGYYPVPLGNRA